jgi:ATP-dependent DNA helicase RecG
MKHNIQQTLADYFMSQPVEKAWLFGSYSRDPILAGACFLGGYIDSWGSGIMKIVNSCKAAGLPTPILEEDGGGFIVRLFKDRFSEEQLQKLGLNDRQIKAVLYVKERGKIINSGYQALNSVKITQKMLKTTSL